MNKLITRFGLTLAYFAIRYLIRCPGGAVMFAFLDNGVKAFDGTPIPIRNIYAASTILTSGFAQTQAGHEIGLHFEKCEKESEEPEVEAPTRVPGSWKTVDQP